MRTPTDNTCDTGLLDRQLAEILDDCRAAAREAGVADPAALRDRVNRRLARLPLSGDRGKFMAFAMAAESMIRDCRHG